MRQVIFMVGPTGCGKTTFRKKNLPHLPCVSPDDFIVGRWTSTKAGLAWGYAKKVVAQLLLEKVSFVLDAQFVDDKTRNDWRRRIELCAGYRAVGIIFNTPWRQIRKNQSKRGDRGLYGKVPLAVQVSAYRRFRADIEQDPTLGFAQSYLAPY